MPIFDRESDENAQIMVIGPMSKIGEVREEIEKVIHEVKNDMPDCPEDWFYEAIGRIKLPDDFRFALVGTPIIIGDS